MNELKKKAFIKDANNLLENEQQFFCVGYTDHNSEFAANGDELWDAVQEIKKAEDYDSNETIFCEVYESGEDESVEVGCGINVNDNEYTTY